MGKSKSNVVDAGRTGDESEETVASVERAPKRTPKRMIEDAGFGMFWSLLTDDDKAAVADQLRVGPLSSAQIALSDATKVAEEKVAEANARVEKARTVESRYLAVLDKCRSLQDTIDRKPTL